MKRLRQAGTVIGRFCAGLNDLRAWFLLPLLPVLVIAALLEKPSRPETILEPFIYAHF